jgi:hypothetical protein
LELAILKLYRVAPSDLWDEILSPRTEANASSWVWKDIWQKQWSSSQGNPTRSVSLAKQALTWLGEFDLTQRGWTSVWTVLWDSEEHETVDRVALIDVAKQWLKIVAPDHPRWAAVWVRLWGASQADPDAVELLIAQAKLWLLGKGPRVEWKLVCRELWSRPELRNDFLEHCARQRLKIGRELDIDHVEEHLAT